MKPLDLSQPLTTIDDGKAWIEALARSGRMFHFEDSPETIVTGLDGKPLFSAHEARHVKARIAELYAFNWGETCPLGFYLSHCEDWGL